MPRIADVKVVIAGFDKLADEVSAICRIGSVWKRLRREDGKNGGVGANFRFNLLNAVFVSFIHIASPVGLDLNRMAELPGAGNGSRQKGFAA